MAIKILKPEDPRPVRRLICLLHGEPGVGKTTLAFSTDTAIMFDFDQGEHRGLNPSAVIPVKKWEDACDPNMASILADYDTVVVDTVGTAAKMLAYHLRGTNAMRIQDFGTLLTNMSNWMEAIRALDKDIVLIGHSRVDKRKKTVNGVEVEYEVIRPDMMGSSRNEIARYTDMMGYLHLHGNARLIEFQPREGIYAKDPVGLGTQQVPEGEYAVSGWLGRLLEQTRSQMNERHEEVANRIKRYAAERSEMETKARAADVHGLNEMMTELRNLRHKMPEVERLERARILRKIADDKGFVKSEESSGLVDVSAKPVEPSEDSYDEEPAGTGQQGMDIEREEERYSNVH